jgi:CIC family chloride channel protein
VAIDEQDRYAGIIWTADAHAAEDGEQCVGDLLHHTGTVLTPQMTVKEAATLFETAEADALAVVDNPETLRVLGLLTEQYALRRYSEELERRRRDLSGE